MDVWIPKVRTAIMTTARDWWRREAVQRIVIVIGAFLVLTIIVAAVDASAYFRDRGKLVVYTLDVGQGDAMFVRFPDHSTMLIDAGPGDEVLEALGRVLPFWERHIDTLLLTHPEADHVGGMPAVLERYSVDRVVMTGVLHTTLEYRVFLAHIRDGHIPTTIIRGPTRETIGGVTLQYLWPRSSVAGESVPALNNTSIIVRMEYGETSFLFTGDSEEDVEERLLASGERLSATVLKIGHHGSDTSSTVSFLEAVHPSLAMISVGRRNRYGHPSRRVLRRLERLGTTILRTDLQGTIRLVSDGTTVQQ